MQAVLLKDVPGLGEAGAVVNVARGFMRNKLVPQGLAEEATAGRIAEIEATQAREAEARNQLQAQAAEWAVLLNQTVLTLSATAGEDGQLFGSITSQDIAKAIQEAREIPVDRHNITIDPPIRAVGTYTVPVQLTPEHSAEVKTIVSAISDDD